METQEQLLVFSIIFLITLAALLMLFKKLFYDYLVPDLKNHNDRNIVIIGAGFSGILQGIWLKKMNFHNFIIIEKYDKVGGVWAKNIYPGCACDVQSHYYSYSFELNPDWSGNFPEQPQIQQYIHRVALKYGLLKHIQFSKKVVKADFDCGKNKWNLQIKSISSCEDYDDVDDKSIENMECDVLACGNGSMNVLNFPDFIKRGKENFKGKIMHCAMYDAKYNLAGKKIALIGNSASAVQVMPFLQKAASKFLVFQRTPYHMIEKPEKTYSKFFKILCKKVPLFMRLYRWSIYFYYEKYFVFLRFKLMQRLADKIFQKKVMKASSILPSETQKQVIPRHKAFENKPCLTNDFYKVLNQPNTQLITDPIHELCENGIKTKDGKVYELDCIVLATGFQINDIGFPVFGIDKNASLQDSWQGMPKAYKGTSHPMFPNFVHLNGPNSVFGHSSQLFAIECQANYSSLLIAHVFQNKIQRFDVKRNVFEEYQKKINKMLDFTPFRNVKMKRCLIYAGPTIQMWWETRKLNKDDYVFSY